MMKNNDLQKVLYAYALRLTCGNKYIAQELLLETLARVAERAVAYYPAVDFYTWAKIVMKTAFHETVADADKREFYQLFYYGTPSPMSRTGNSKHGLREQIYIMSRLTPCQATVATLLLNGYAPEVITDEMDTSVECLKAHLDAMRQTLITALGN